MNSNARLLAEIAELRKECNAVILTINRGYGTATPGFQTINKLLKACDRVFAADDKRKEMEA